MSRWQAGFFFGDCSVPSQHWHWNLGSHSGPSVIYSCASNARTPLSLNPHPARSMMALEEDEGGERMEHAVIFLLCPSAWLCQVNTFSASIISDGSKWCFITTKLHTITRSLCTETVAKQSKCWAHLNKLSTTAQYVNPPIRTKIDFRGII